KYPAKLAELKTQSPDAKPAPITPCIPVIALQPVESGGVIATLGTPGRNLVRIDAQGGEKWRATTAGWYQPRGMRGNATTGDSIVWDMGTAWAEEDDISWRHDGAGK